MLEERWVFEPPFQDDILAAAAAAPWLPGATSGLARRQWVLLQRETGLTEATYGTDRVLAKNVAASKIVRAKIALPPAFEQTRPVAIEYLLGANRYTRLGLRFASLSPGPTAAAVGRLMEALEVVERVGSLARAVGCVLSTVHILEPPGPDHDVSFSDPDVPFSTFVSIHNTSAPHAAVRLAEQIVHESMHLQLTLLEAVHPMTSADIETHWSPWQERMRPTRGVLHGLYVFKVLDAFFAELAMEAGLEAGRANHVERRRRELGVEIADAAASLSRSAELTSFGRAFLDSILAFRKTHP